MRIISFTFALCLFTTINLFAQQTTPTPPKTDDDVLKISTTLIQVDVTVTDKDGNVVRDLKPEEFEIYENGKKQKITNFSFISIDPQKKTTEENTAQTKRDKNAAPLPPVKLKAEQVRRTYAVVIDDLGISFENLMNVRQSLKKFINEQMQEGDLVAVIRTGSGIGALQSFTTDKRLLLAAVEKIRWNPQGRGGIGSFVAVAPNFKEQLGGEQPDGTVRQVAGTEEDREFQGLAEEFRADNFSIGTLGSLNYIIRGMRELPGRKSLLLVSEGFQMFSHQRDKMQQNKVFDAMKILADLANRSSVVFYTLDPRGLMVPSGLQAQDNTYLMTREEVTAQLTKRDEEFHESQQSLRYLAYETGGFPFVNQNNLFAGLEKVVEEQGSYYLLGYQPDEETFDPKKNKFNKLEIKLTRPGLKVRYRSGFFGITDEKIMQTTAQTPQEKLLSALTSPFGANGINLSLYPIFQNDAKNGDVIEALVYIDAKDLQFSPAAEGKQKANFDIVAMTFGDNGMVVDKLSRNYTLEVEEKVYRNMLKNGFVYTLPVPVKKTGAYQFRIALRDTVSEKIGSASQFIEVPNIKKRMALSNLVLDNFTADEWQKIRLGSREESEKSVLLDTSLRQFKSGTILRYDYVIYNPKQSRQIKTEMRLIRDGKIVYEENPVAVKNNGQSDLQRLSAAGAITLGKNLPAGSYVLQITAFDGLNNKNFAAQFVEFEIVN